jgi:ABC-type multidrug transport system ATPase subunit
LYSRLTVRENLRLFSDVAGQGDPELQIRSWDLTTVADTQVSELSKGNQARVSLARAMLAEPSVVLLDEPSSNLDERGTRVLVDAISSAHERHEGRFLAVIATHDIHRLRDIATRVMVLEKGVLAADSGTASTKDAIDAVIDAYREANR